MINKMEMRSNLVAISLMLMLASTAKLAQSLGGVFDVTKYGAKTNADIVQALSNAWKEACASTSASKVLIPKGTYKLSAITIKGPCKSPVEIKLQGTLQAPSDPKGDAWVTFTSIDRLTLSGGGVFDGQGKYGWKKNSCNKNFNSCNKLPISLRFNFLTNSTVRDITSLNSKNFHINVLGCTNLLMNHVTITAPQNSPNTDGIHIGRSNGVNITNTKIQTGDDCISLGDGCQKISITEVVCGPGHGISIGSLGKYNGEEPVKGVFVKKCKLINTSNGVRIKTWPASTAGTAADMHFEDIEMVNVSNPILIDQEYCPWNQCNKKAPSKIKISKVSFRNIHGTSATPVAVKLVCSNSAPCEGVEVSNIDLAYHGHEGSITSECCNVKPKLSGKQSPLICAAKVASILSSSS